WPKSSPFSKQALDLTLDSHRYKGKNTHELIVLPAIRQVLPADLALRRWPLAGRHALASWQRSSLLSANSQSRFPRQQEFILARGLSVGALAPGPRIGIRPRPKHSRQTRR